MILQCTELNESTSVLVNLHWTSDFMNMMLQSI